MQVEPQVASLDPQAITIAKNLRWGGLLSFWLQLILAAATGLMLLFAIAGRNFSQRFEPSVPGFGIPNGVGGTTPGIGIGTFWAVVALIVLLFNLYLALRISHLGKRIRHPNPHQRPQRVQVIQILKLGVIMGLIGMVLAFLGEGTTLGVLLAKSIALPQGIAVFDPNRIIRALDIFVALANLAVLLGHFISTVAPLALLNLVQRSS